MPKAPALTAADQLDPFVLGTERPASVQVFEFLRTQVIKGRIVPGTALSEAGLCRHFGVSRQPVREALLRLSMEDLVEVYPQRGSVVTKISVPMIYRAQLVREAVEVETLSRAIERQTPKFIAALRTELKLQQAFAEAHDIERFFVSDQAFHRTICEQSGVHGVWETLETSRAQLDRARHVELMDREPLGLLIEQHEAILGGIVARDRPDATDAMRTHLRRVIDVIDGSVARFPDLFDRGGHHAGETRFG